MNVMAHLYHFVKENFLNFRCQDEEFRIHLEEHRARFSIMGPNCF